jgi:hypothetical protein
MRNLAREEHGHSSLQIDLAPDHHHDEGASGLPASSQNGNGAA